LGLRHRLFDADALELLVAQVRLEVDDIDHGYCFLICFNRSAVEPVNTALSMLTV
jgi:hypothetical protein